VTQPLSQALAAFEPDLPVTVAFSGGADSSALLLACVQKWPGQVDAVHVHHGLQSAADDFVRHAQRVCHELNVPLALCHVDARHQPGQSPEDAARTARYGAFAQLARQRQAQGLKTEIALAQHADDQVETLLLALSRGAGLPGMSAMAQQFERDGVVYHRPFLRVAQREIRQWLQEQGLGFIEDPSNTEQRFTRNRIRATVLPALQSCFADFLDTFSRSAAHAAQAQRLLEEVAIEDLSLVGNPPLISKLQALSTARQANVLRHWLKSGFQAVPSTAQMQELLHQIDACRTGGHDLDIKLANGRIRRLGKALDWYNP